MLNSMGYETLIVTTDKNWNQAAPTTNSLVLGAPTIRNLLPNTLTIHKEMKKFCPDLIIVEESTDPRFLISNLFRRCEIWLCKHDPAPHDENHVYNLRQDFTVKLNSFCAKKVLTFSEASRKELGADKVWSLLPEFPLASINLERAIEHSRKHFVTFGRIEPYKNIEWLVRFWNSNEEALGDEKLYIIGYGQETFKGRNIVHENLRYDANELMKRLPSFRASIFPYKSASQSGVLLLSQLAGLSAITSPLTGLTEFQAHDQNVMEALNDEQSLKRILLRYLQEGYAQSQGSSAMQHANFLIELSRSSVMESLKVQLKK
jgi:glycosyltransferase involved in cell wall biosynthesis